MKSILSGAVIGGALTAAGIFGFPSAGLNDEGFLMIMEAVFGRFFVHHHIFIFICLSVLIGASLGFSRIKIKRWWLYPVVFVVGITIGSGVVFLGLKRLAEKMNAIWESNYAQQEAQMSLLFLRSIDRGSNSIARFEQMARSNLTNYIRDVEEQKKERQKLDEGTLYTYQTARAYLFPFTFAEKRESDFFWNKMLPLAQEFVTRNGLPAVDFNTNNISKYRIEFFQDGRHGCTADLKLKGGYSFSFLSDGTNAEVWAFNDGRTKTYYELDNVPKEEIDAIKALNLRNKLNDKTALETAERFFKLEGHKEENFHPAELKQSYWVGKNDEWGYLPYYQTTWYRKDVTDVDRKSGTSTLPVVMIEVSGVDAHLISYTKAFMPVSKDF
ncbi:MAG TPA: hypothetical protein VIK59_07785 [Verrucomicrobiae bacterium]